MTPKIHFFTVASDDNHHLQRLLSSAAQHDIAMTVLGLGEPYEGNGMKIAQLTTALKQLDPNDIFMYVDAYDVIFLSNEQEIAQKYLDYYDGQLVYGGEQNFGMYSADDIYYYMKYPIKKGRYRFLNAGTIMGRAGHALEVYQKIGLSSTQTSDQMDTIRYVVKHPSNITVDYRHSIFAVNGGRAGLEDRDYQVKEGRVYSVLTDSWPTILHVPGKFFMGLDKIAVELGYMNETPSYTKAELSRYRSERRDHLICDRLGIGNYPYRLIKNWSINIAILIVVIQLGQWIWGYFF